MDLWINRSMNRMTGNMFKFEESSFRGHAENVKQRQLAGDIDVPAAKSAKMLSEIDKIQAAKSLTGGSLDRMAPTLLDWAHEQHNLHEEAIAGPGRP
jgi:hypothetical protein